MSNIYRKLLIYKTARCITTNMMFWLKIRLPKLARLGIIKRMWTKLSKYSPVARYLKVSANFSPAGMLFLMLVSCLCSCVFTIFKSSSKQVWSIRKKFLKAAASSARSSWTSMLYALRVRFLLIYGFVQTFLFFQRFWFLLRRLTYNRTKKQAATLRECHCTTSAMLQI